MGFYFRKPLTIALIGLSSVMAAKPSFAEAPGYNFVDLAYTHINLDSVANLDGFTLAGSAELGENWYLFGSYSDTEQSGVTTVFFSSEVDVQQTQIGAGHYWSTSDSTNIFLSASYVDVEVNARNASADGNGFAISTGLRGNISENLELNAALSYADVEDTDGAELAVGAIYSFSDRFGLLLGASVDDDSNASGSLGVRFNF